MRSKGSELWFWYGVFLSAFTGAIAILFIVGAALIYFGADPDTAPYSYELVSERFLHVMLAPFLIWIAAVAGGFVLSVLYPDAEKRRARDDEATLKKLRRRIPAGEGEAFLAERKKFGSYRIARIAVRAVCTAFAVASAIVAVVYLADAGHFPAVDPTGEVIAMVRSVFPWIGASFVLFLGATVYERVTVKRDLASAKRLLVLGRGAPSAPQSAVLAKAEAVRAAAKSKPALYVARACVAVAGIVLFAVGIANGGMSDVLIKAVKICTECIGLG